MGSEEQALCQCRAGYFVAGGKESNGVVLTARFLRVLAR
jgi:hypothetical protein